MAKWDRRFEDEAHLRRRIQLIKSGQCQTHDQIDDLFANEQYEKLSYSELKEAERQLEINREQLAEDRKVFETQVQETQTELEDLETQIKLKRQIVDETNLNTSLRKLQYFMNNQQNDFQDMTLVAFLYLENGKWASKYFPIKKKSETVVLETCEALRKDAVGV